MTEKQPYEIELQNNIYHAPTNLSKQPNEIELQTNINNCIGVLSMVENNTLTNVSNEIFDTNNGVIDSEIIYNDKWKTIFNTNEK